MLPYAYTAGKVKYIYLPVTLCLFSKLYFMYDLDVKGSVGKNTIQKRKKKKLGWDETKNI